MEHLSKQLLFVYPTTFFRSSFALQFPVVVRTKLQEELHRHMPEKVEVACHYYILNGYI